MGFIWKAKGQKALLWDTDMIQEYAIKHQCGLNYEEGNESYENNSI